MSNTLDYPAGSTELVHITDGVPTITSLVIAAHVGMQHKNVRELIEDNQDSFQQFGVCRFQTAKPSEQGGRPIKYAILTEPQATLLMTFMRNTEKVKAFKVALVKAFYAMRAALTTRQSEINPRQQAELLTKADLARMVLESEEEKAVMAAALESAAPMIAYHDRYISNDDAALIEVWGAQFGLTRPQAFALLVDHKMIYRRLIMKRYSKTEDRVVEEYEYRAYARYIDWFDLRPQHDAPRHHNGQVRQTLYVRQEFALQIAEKCGLSSAVAS